MDFLEIPGCRRSRLKDFNSSTMADNFDAERPATAHLRSVGRVRVIYSAHSFPVYPVAPKRMISYSF